MARRILALLLIALLCPLAAPAEIETFSALGLDLDVPEGYAAQPYTDESLREVSFYRGDGLELALAYHRLPENLAGRPLMFLNHRQMREMVRLCSRWWIPDDISFDPAGNLLVFQGEGLYGLLALRGGVAISLRLSRESGGLRQGDLDALALLMPAFDAALRDVPGDGAYVFPLGLSLILPKGYTLTEIQNDRFSGVTLRDGRNTRLIEIGYLGGYSQALEEPFSLWSADEIQSFTRDVVDEGYPVLARYQPVGDYIRMSLETTARGALRRTPDGLLLGISIESTDGGELVAADLALLQDLMGQTGFFAAPVARMEPYAISFLGQELTLPEGYVYQQYDDSFDALDIQDPTGNLTYVLSQDPVPEGMMLDFSLMTEEEMRSLVHSQIYIENPFTPNYHEATDEIFLDNDAGTVYGRLFLRDGYLCLAGVERVDGTPLLHEEKDLCDEWCALLWPSE